MYIRKWWNIDDLLIAQDTCDELAAVETVEILVAYCSEPPLGGSACNRPRLRLITFDIITNLSRLVVWWVSCGADWESRESSHVQSVDLLYKHLVILPETHSASLTSLISSSLTNSEVSSVSGSNSGSGGNRVGNMTSSSVVVCSTVHRSTYSRPRC